MKKIVALVLAMVMVLGLATTAFAAKLGEDTLENAKKDAGWNYNVELDDAEDAKDQTFATYEIEAVAKKDMTSDAFWLGTATDVEKDDDFDIEGSYIKVVNPDYADLVMVDGKVITYFHDVSVYDDDFTWDAKAVKVTLPGTPADTGDMKCNTLYNVIGAPGTFYYDAAEDVLYVASKADEPVDAILNVDGLAVFARVAGEKDDPEADYDDYDYNPHSLIVNWTNRTSTVNAVPTKVYCQNCKAEFKFAYGDEEDAIAMFGAGNYIDAPVDASMTYRVPVWVELIVPVNYPTAAGTSAPSVDGDKVESPKTFDAGIAMYVGMSVMAAAGSAVVLKKKD